MAWAWVQRRPSAILVADVDDLDPVCAPGTDTPEVGALPKRQAQKLPRGLQGLYRIGGDVVEVSLPFDPSCNIALNGARNLLFINTFIFCYLFQEKIM